MKMLSIKKILAAAAALCLAFAMLTACGKSTDTDSSESTSGTSASEEDTASTDETVEEVTAATLREVADGDVFAINKFTVDDLPDGYELVNKSQLDGAQYMRYLIDEGKAQVTVEAANYREDFQDLSVFAENACANMAVGNMYYACDTEFSDPVDTTVAGFDAIRYDYTITQNDFELDDEGNAVTGDDGKDIKTPVAWYKGRAYFFYSDNDVYYFIFETTEDNWDASIDTFEEFAASVYINENAENDPVEETETETETEETTETASSDTEEEAAEDTADNADDSAESEADGE
jgi:hypothetical protein